MADDEKKKVEPMKPTTFDVLRAMARSGKSLPPDKPEQPSQERKVMNGGDR